MKENDILLNDLIDTIILEHNENKLGKERILSYLERKTNELGLEDFSMFNFLKLLTKKGYEIKLDTSHFDIVNYNNQEYISYMTSLKFRKLKNEEELKLISKTLYKKLLCLYNEDKYKSLRYYFESLFKNTTFSLEQEAFLRVNIINSLSDEGYTILNIDPLVLKKN